MVVNSLDFRLPVPLWELTPVRPRHSYWRASCFRQRVIIRAPTAGRARGIAATEFEPEFARYEARDDALSPWLTPHLVTVRRIETADYPADGEDGILDPPPGWREAMGDADG